MIAPTYTLRDYQEEGVAGIERELQAHRSTLAVCPTGGGKTIIFGEVVRRFLDRNPQRRVLIMAHRDELIRQAADKVGRIIDEPCDIEMADYQADTWGFDRSRVVVTSVQTMSRVNRHQKFHPNEFGLLIVDEAHHAVAPSYLAVQEYFQRNPDLRLLGVTATPDRADELAMGRVFESVAMEVGIIDMIEGGWLVPILQQFVRVEGLDLSRVKTTAGDLNQRQLAEILNEEQKCHQVISPTLEIAAGRQTLVFGTSVEQAELMAEIANRFQPGCADWICGDQVKCPRDRRRQILSDFSRGEFQVLVNVGVLLEGYDEPRVEVVACARPTKSRSLYAQMIGRGTRTVPGLVDRLASPEDRRAAIASSEKPCIAEGQRVLTDQGLIPIEQVTQGMKVWDGVDFVSHCGILFRGVKRVLTYAGLTATPDHEVWTHDETSQSTLQETRKTFGECAAEQTALRVTGVGGKAIREVDGYFRAGDSEERTAEDVNPLRLRGGVNKGLVQPDTGQSRVSSLWSTLGNSCVASQAGNERTTTMLQSQKCGVQILRGSRNRVSIQELLGHGAVGYGQPRAKQTLDTRQNQQQRPLRAWESSLGKPNDSEQQPTRPAVDCIDTRTSTGTPRDTLFATASNEDDSPRNDGGADIEATCGEGWGERTSRAVQGTARVFDILNAGPRHRFTVEGILVSNCLTVLDFVGNSGNHKLIHTGDILGGNYDDEIVAMATQAALNKSDRGERADMLAELRAAEEARKEARRRQRQTIAVHAAYKTKTIDPFDVLDLSPKREPGWHKGRLPTEKQRACLEKAGVSTAKLSFWQASQLIGETMKRRDQKLCTFKQAKLLSRYGESTEVSFEEASRLIDRIAKNGWKPLVQKSAPVGAPY